MRKEKAPPVPAEQFDSVRQQIIGLLREGSHSARDLSVKVHIPEKEVYGHLDHIRRSAGHRKLQLIIRPAVCHKCGFTFDKRKKLNKPGKCPFCRGEQIGAPRFAIKGG